MEDSFLLAFSEDIEACRLQSQEGHVGLEKPTLTHIATVLQSHFIDLPNRVTRDEGRLRFICPVITAL